MQENTSSANQKLISNYGLTITSLSTRRQNAITYATTNSSKVDPASGGQNVPFTNVSPGCTEFVSHCLLAGGFRQVVGTPLGWDGVNVK
ncbi:amidase domain-containing protein [Acetivibrio clariflavus]|uniref:amidase domain-containing protein n=1 Tax=Acetivibrio clariflavus TaxID=288965 RepID=UPI0012FECAA7